jgi:hypothetical protein
MSDDTTINLFVFWRHHDGTMYTFLGGRADKLRSDGAYHVKPYGWCTKPDRVMPVDEGNALLAEIQGIARETHEQIKQLKTDGKTRIDALISGQP